MSTLKIQFMSLSMGAAVDQQTGSLSIFDLVEELRTPQVPFHIQNLVMALALEKIDLDLDFHGRIGIEFFPPEGKSQVVGSGEMRIPSDQKRIKAIFRFGGFQIHHFGPHRFVLSCYSQSGAKLVESALVFEVVKWIQSETTNPSTHKPPTSH